MNGLRLGPLLRWVDRTSATIWVETERPGTVEVLDHSCPTFTVAGHHYALVVVEGLSPGSTHEYEVLLDGHKVWPEPQSQFPPSSIRTLDDAGPVRLAFGSCRVSGPRSSPFGLDRLIPRYDPRLDALQAFAARLIDRADATRPDLLLLLGDQVYADDPPRQTIRLLELRHGPDHAKVTDYEDYASLYQHSWLDDPRIRWLLSTVPTAMIFDDHELVDNWNISAAWVDEKRAQDGWDARLDGALMSYWIYQHLGNLSPAELARSGLYGGVRSDADGAGRLRRYVRELDQDRDGSRWAFRRDLGEVRLLVLDTRATRVLEEGQRDMLDPAEWRWLEANLDGARHVVLASSVPFVYAQGFHELQVWSQRLTAGAWGRSAAAFAERLRRRLSLSGWPSFPASLDRLMSLLRDLAAGRRGTAPSSITLVSGDVHHGYVGAVNWPDDAAARTPVHQVVTSPFRNPLRPHERLAQRFAASRVGSRMLAALARAAGGGPASFSWRREVGVDFANQISTLVVGADAVHLHTEAASRGVRRGRYRLRTLWRRRLA